jgi:hypothetical protein
MEEENVFDLIRNERKYKTKNCTFCKGLGLLPTLSGKIINCTHCIKDLDTSNIFNFIINKQKQETLDCYICDGLRMFASFSFITGK